MFLSVEKHFWSILILQLIHVIEFIKLFGLNFPFLTGPLGANEVLQSTTHWKKASQQGYKNILWRLSCQSVFVSGKLFKRKARYLTGDNLKVVWPEFLT